MSKSVSLLEGGKIPREKKGLPGHGLRESGAAAGGGSHVLHAEEFFSIVDHASSGG